MSNWLSRRFRDAVDFWIASQRHQASVWPCASRYLRFALREGYSPEEIILLGLLDPRTPAKAMEGEISKSKMLRLQQQINPADQFALTEDKIVFFRHCRDHALPTPEILALYGESPDQESALTPLQTPAQLAAFLDACRLDDLVLKPVHGVHGQGVLILARQDELYRDIGSNQAYDTEALARFTQKFPYKKWMLQERLFGHPELCELSDTQSLQTARVVTYTRAPDDAEIVGARLRIIASSAGYDNFNFGASGNLVAAIDPERGVLTNVLGVPDKHRGVQSVSIHPISKRRLQDYQLPEWENVRALVVKAAQAFWPLRTIGWDVGITNKGPCLIEGNVTWDPLPGDDRFRRFYDALTRS